MALLEKFLSRFQLVYRRSHIATKIVVILVLVLCIGALITLRLTMNNIQSQTDDLRSKAAALTAENEELQEDIDQLGSVQSVIEIAEEELDLVKPGTVIFETEP